MIVLWLVLAAVVGAVLAHLVNSSQHKIMPVEPEPDPTPAPAPIIVAEPVAPPVAVEPPPQRALDAVVLAVQDAFMECGLPAHEFTPFFDLARAGKLNEVLHCASASLGIDHPLRTVHDVTTYLRSV